MTQYVMFQPTPDIEKAIENRCICDLTPNKVYEVLDETIIDDDGCSIEIIPPEYDYPCPHLAEIAQWQYCDADGNIL